MTISRLGSFAAYIGQESRAQWRRVSPLNIPSIARNSLFDDIGSFRCQESEAIECVLLEVTISLVGGKWGK